MLTDIDIAQQAKLLPIAAIAARLGIPDEAIEPYGRTKGKISLDWLAGVAGRPDGRLVLVSAISPTPAGEGKTTTVVGLGDALNRIGKKAVICLREPSLGPVFGMKGGAAGGGYAQVVPMEDINLHFTGDFNAIGVANNLLAALLDNHIHHGNALGIDVRRITWKRVVDMNDRALREINVALGGPANGYPRQDGFDIVVASEVMAIFCLADSLADLKARLADIVVGYTRDRKPVHARDLAAHGAMAALLRDAIKPNLVQTLENNPALIHGGPFGNIAHGCNSVIATKAGLKLADYVVTEAGSARTSAPRSSSTSSVASRGSGRTSWCWSRRCARSSSTVAWPSTISHARTSRRWRRAWPTSSGTSTTCASTTACPASSRSTISTATPAPRSRCCNARSRTTTRRSSSRSTGRTAAPAPRTSRAPWSTPSTAFPATSASSTTTPTRCGTRWARSRRRSTARPR
jgi:hypothetical protein